MPRRAASPADPRDRTVICRTGCLVGSPRVTRAGVAPGACTVGPSGQRRDDRPTRRRRGRPGGRSAGSCPSTSKTSPAGVRSERPRAVVEEVRRAEDRAVVGRPEELADHRRRQRRRREERRPEQPREEVELPGLADQREVEERGRPEPVGEHERGAGADPARHGAGGENPGDVGRRPEAHRVRGHRGRHAEVRGVGRQVRGHQEVREAASHEPAGQRPEGRRPEGGPPVHRPGAGRDLGGGAAPAPSRPARRGARRRRCRAPRPAPRP